MFHLRGRSSRFGRALVALSMVSTGLVTAVIASGLAVSVGATAAAAAAPPVESAVVALGDPEETDTSVGVLPVGADDISGRRQVLPPNVGRAVDEVVSPTGDVAYLAIASPPAVAVVDGSTGALIRLMALASDAVSMALGRDGSELWVAEANGTAVDLDTSTGGQIWPVYGATPQINPVAIAIGPVNPDPNQASWVYVASSDGVVDVVASVFGYPVATIPVCAQPDSEILSPDATQLYVGCDDAEIDVIDIASRSVIGTLDTPDGAVRGLAISPDGATLYTMETIDSSSASIGVIDLATGDETEPFRTFRPGDLALSPDGRQLWFADEMFGGITELDTATFATLRTVNDSFNLVAFVPDQAPVARLSVPTGTVNQPVHLDASASSVLYGTITSYAWTFGDGGTATTSTPTVDHTYATTGAYTVTVTETDSAGTSTTQVFNGHQVLRNGGPGAQTSITENVVAHGTTTTLTSSANPARYAQNATIAASVKSTGTGVPKPTGQVVFTVDGADQPPTTMTNGKATLPLSSLTPGTHTVLARYLGDSANPPSASTSLTQTITTDATTTTITSSTNPAVSGQAGSVTVTVAPVAPGAGTPTGTVTVTIDGTDQPQANLTNGKTTVALASLPVGTHIITAAYDGTAFYDPSTGTAYNQQINRAVTTTTLTTTASPAVHGQNGTITATVRLAAPATGTPTGTITFSIDGTAQTPVTLTAGKATMPLTSLPVGAHTIVASYDGDLATAPSTSGPLDETINPAATTITTTTTKSVISGTQSATITATVKVTAPGTGTPTGTITFSIDGLAQTPTPIAAGKALLLLTAASLGTGPHTIIATFSGDANLSTATSAPLTETVT